MMKQVLILMCITASTLAIAPQVRAPPARPFAFSGSQNVPRPPIVPLSHPLPSTNTYNNNNYNSNSNTNRYTSGVSSSSSGTYNQGNPSFASSTNRVNTYAPAAAAAVRRPSSSSSYSPSSSSSSYNTNTRTNEITNLRSVFEDNADGSYHYVYENSDGTKSEQRGYLKNAGSDNEIFVQEGSYSYYGPDGVMYTVNYISDENGYQPSGAHLPALPTPVRSSSGHSSSQGSSYRRPVAVAPVVSNNNNNYNRNSISNNNFNNNNNNNPLRFRRP